MKKFAAVIILLAMCLSVLAACSPAPAADTDKVEVALLTYAASNETTKYVCDVIQKLGTEKGWTVQFTDTAGGF